MCFDTHVHVHVESLRVYQYNNIYKHCTRSQIFLNIARAYPPFTLNYFAVISSPKNQSSQLLYWNRVNYSAISKNTPDNSSYTGVSRHFYKRKRQIRKKNKAAAIFSYFKNLLDHSVKYQKLSCRFLHPCGE